MRVSANTIGSKSEPRSRLVISEQSQTNVAYEKLNLDAISVANAHFLECRFESIKAKSVSLGSGLKKSTYTRCVFKECDWTFGAIGDVRFVDCVFNGCKLTNLYGVSVEMLRCSFPATRIRRAVFHAFDPDSTSPSFRRHNEFSDNDFSQSVMIDVDFRGGIDMSKQNWPIDGDHVLVRDLEMAKHVFNRLRESAHTKSDRETLDNLITLSDFYTEQGQKSQLFNIKQFGTMAVELMRVLPDAMQGK